MFLNYIRFNTSLLKRLNKSSNKSDTSLKQTGKNVKTDCLIQRTQISTTLLAISE